MKLCPPQNPHGLAYHPVITMHKQQIKAKRTQREGVESGGKGMAIPMK
jgi:hypothetical protein